MWQGLVAHLWNILWALTTAFQSQAPTLAASSATSSPPSTPADAVVGDGFDYAAYATLRWERYLWEKERAGGDRSNGGGD